jgi:methylglutaconyl-CoA hydratase
MTPPLVIESHTDAIAVLALNRPERRNALTVELMETLCKTFAELAADSERRVVILRGAGPAFCAGLDLIEAADPALAEQSAECVARLLTTILESPLVTIAVAHGAAYAGGAGILSACDFAIAADDLRISFPEVRRGLVPALVSVVLQDRLRDADVRKLLLLGEAIDANRAKEIGLVHRVVPADCVLDEARLLAETILLGAPNAVRLTKRLLRSTDHSARFAAALEVHKLARSSDEAREGIAAFREKREPKWSGG